MGITRSVLQSIIQCSKQFEIFFKTCDRRPLKRKKKFGKSQNQLFSKTFFLLNMACKTDLQMPILTYFEKNKPPLLTLFFSQIAVRPWSTLILAKNSICKCFLELKIHYSSYYMELKFKKDTLYRNHNYSKQVNYSPSSIELFMFCLKIWS